MRRYAIALVPLVGGLFLPAPSVMASPPEFAGWSADDPTHGLDDIWKPQPLVDECGKRLYQWAHRKEGNPYSEVSDTILEYLGKRLGFEPVHPKTGEPLPEDEICAFRLRFLSPFLAYSIRDNEVRNWARGTYGNSLPYKLKDLGVPARDAWDAVGGKGPARLERNAEYDAIRDGARHAIQEPIRQKKLEQEQAARKRLESWHRSLQGRPPLKDGAKTSWRPPEFNELANEMGVGVLVVQSNEDANVVLGIHDNGWVVFPSDGLLEPIDFAGGAFKELIIRHSNMSKPQAVRARIVPKKYLDVPDPDMALAMVNSEKVIMNIREDSNVYTFTMSGSETRKAREHFNHRKQGSD